MSKRLSDTEKWRDPWFRKLSAGMKLAFWFLVDNCDAAGVWEPDFDGANFAVGSKVPWDKVLEKMGDRVKVLPSGKWHLTRFVQFQYGALSPDCRPHAVIIALLEKHGIPSEVKGSNRVSKGNPNGTGKVLDPGDDAKPPKRAPLTETDEAWLAGLEKKDCYRPIKIRVELEKAQAWCETNRRECTRKFFVNWLNRALTDARISIPKATSAPQEDPAGWREFLTGIKRGYEAYRYAPGFLKTQFSKSSP